MRISAEQRQSIRDAASELAGAGARVTLFGSRADDAARGGDIDLLIECDEPVERPAWLAASIAARLERVLGGRRIDVLLAAPNLQSLPVHRIARETGVAL